MFFIFLTCMSNFVTNKYYLLFDLLTYFLFMILNYKNLKFKYLIDNVVINFWSSENQVYYM